jgi:DMSO/TMAO reductase YedYZ molybdopterin-dependent catalytic subunit
MRFTAGFVMVTFVIAGSGGFHGINVIADEPTNANAKIKQAEGNTVGKAAEVSSETILKVTGEVERPLTLKQTDLARLPRTKVSVTEHGNERAEFEGVQLHEILKSAGVAHGERLRGEAVSLVVLVGAPDGYRVSFGIADLDPGFTDRVVLLADHRNGELLSDPQGPLRLVVPDDKRHGRWVRTVESITVVLPPAPPETKRTP